MMGFGETYSTLCLNCSGWNLCYAREIEISTKEATDFSQYKEK
jgi:hypothetical protein